MKLITRLVKLTLLPITLLIVSTIFILLNLVFGFANFIQKFIRDSADDGEWVYTWFKRTALDLISSKK